MNVKVISERDAVVGLAAGRRLSVFRAHVLLCSVFVKYQLPRQNDAFAAVGLHIYFEQGTIDVIQRFAACIDHADGYLLIPFSEIFRRAVVAGFDGTVGFFCRTKQPRRQSVPPTAAAPSFFCSLVHSSFLYAWRLN